MIHLTDPADPRIAGYRALRDRDAERDGCFIAESENVVRVLATRSRYRPRSFFFAENRVEAMRDVIDRAEAPVFVAPQDVLSAVAGFDIHRGVLALAERGAPPREEEILGGDGLVVAMIGLTNHDNVGGIFRSAAAFGVHALVLDGATCDPLYRKAIRVSVGAALVLPFLRLRSGHDVLDALARHDFEAVGLSPRAGETVGELPRAPRRALVLGTEQDGLPDELLARTRRARIAQTTAIDSLNVGVACAIALYEVAGRRIEIEE